MKTQKLNFANIKNVLSRGEMKKIMAGSSGGGGGQGGGGGGGVCRSFANPCDFCCPGAQCVTIGGDGGPSGCSF